jgi:hypothetical protein
MPEFYLGIDVGYSKSNDTTGLCLITLNQTRFQWECRNTGTQESKRRKDLKNLIPRGTTLTAVGIDGPLASGFQIVDRYRAADSLLYRGQFHSRCKPGSTGSRRGQLLHRYATEWANFIIKLKEEGCLYLDDANHPDPIHGSRIIEVFPTGFLGFLLSKRDFRPVSKSEKKSDVFWEIALSKGYLARLLRAIGGEINRQQSLDCITDHEHRAAFICALGAMCVSKARYVATGDPEDGDIFLPPVKFWGFDTDSKSHWPETALRKNVVSVRRNREQRTNHDKARVIRNGCNWL